MVKISNQRLKRLLPVLCAVLLLTALPLCALADSDAPFSSYVIFGGADFAQLRLDSEHPYLYNTGDGHHEVSQTLRTGEDWCAWFDASSGTVHLNNFYTTDYANVNGVYTMLCSESSRSLIVDMHGENVMRYPQTFVPARNTFAIYCKEAGSVYGDLTFRSSDGDGKLTVEQISTDPGKVCARPIVIQWAHRNSAKTKGNHVIMESGELYLIQKGMANSSSEDFYVIHAGVSIDIKGGRIYSEMDNPTKRAWSGVNDSVPNRGVYTGGHYTAKKTSRVGWLSSINQWLHPQFVWTNNEALEGQYDLYNTDMKPNTSANYLDVIPYTRVIIRLPDGSTLEKMGFYDRDLPTLTADELPKRPGYVYQGCVDETGFEWYDVNGVGGHLKTTELVMYLDPVWKAIPQTGDNAPLAILCVLCACAGVGVWMMTRKKRA